MKELSLGVNQKCKRTESRASHLSTRYSLPSLRCMVYTSGTVYQREPVVIVCTSQYTARSSFAAVTCLSGIPLFVGLVVVDDDVVFDNLPHWQRSHVNPHIFPDYRFTPKHCVPCPESRWDMRWSLHVKLIISYLQPKTFWSRFQRGSFDSLNPMTLIAAVRMSCTGPW